MIVFLSPWKSAINKFDYKGNYVCVYIVIVFLSCPTYCSSLYVLYIVMYVFYKSSIELRYNTSFMLVFVQKTILLFFLHGRMVDIRKLLETMVLKAAVTQYYQY